MNLEILMSKPFFIQHTEFFFDIIGNSRQYDAYDDDELFWRSQTPVVC